MFSNVNIVNHNPIIQAVFETEANAILNLHQKISSDMNDAIQLILNCNGRVIVTGIGKSGIIGKKIAATLASTGTPSIFLHPAEGLHGDLGMVTERDIVFGISNSGETEEILKILPSIKRIGARIISLVGNKNSTLADKSEVVISYGAVEEACPLGLAPTTSTTVSLVVGDAIAIALLKARDFKPENFALFHPGGSLGKKLLLTIEDIINQTPVNPIIHMSSDVKEVLFKMTESGFGAVSIVDDSGKLVGLLTDGDIRRALTKGNYILETPIDYLFTKDPITIKADILATEALRMMENKKINVLPVVDEAKKPIAMVHIHLLTKIGL